MRRGLVRRLAFGLLIVAGLLAVAVIATTRWGDRTLWPPAPGTPGVEIFIISHGYHSGIVVPKKTLDDVARQYGLAALGAVATRFAGYDWLEIGWGETEFYRDVPTAASLNLALAARALLHPGNSSVLHVVAVKGAPRAMFPVSDLVGIKLGMAGFERMAAKLDATFARGPDGSPEALGPGLYGPSLFFRANGSFHLFNVCNHWIARLLDAAGVPTSPVLATLPSGLLLDLEWRSGLVPVPRR
jgi:uncharacterized protein (TIGR02117 family)